MSLRRILPAALLLLLAGCALPQTIRKTEQDKARLDQQQNERDVNAQCNQGAMPGTVQHMACRMSAEKSPPK